MSLNFSLVILLGMFVTVSSFRIDQSLLHTNYNKSNEQKNLQQKRFFQPNQLANITNFEFISINDMHRWQHLNKTFTFLNQAGLNYNEVWKINDTLMYSILNATPIFICQDQKQKAQLIGSNTVFLDGVYSTVTLNFTWKIKNGNEIKSGYATAYSLSNQIAYAFDFVEDKQNPGFIKNILMNYIDKLFPPFKLVKFQPQISQQQKYYIKELLNNSSTAITIKEQFDSDFQNKFPSYLQINLQDIHSLRAIDKEYSYSWYKNQQVCTVYTEKIPIFFRFYNKLGVSIGYTNSFKYLKDQQFKLIQIPSNLPVETFGGRQQFVSYQFYKNFLSYFIKENCIGSKISKYQWSTKNFKFYASELFSIFNNLDVNFGTNDQVEGTCYAKDFQNITVLKSTDSSFNVTFNLICNFKINQRNIVDIDISLQLEIYGVPKSNTIDFWIKSLSPVPKIKDVYGFKLLDRPALVRIIREVSFRLYENRIIGSGWKLPVTQIKPIFTTIQTGTFITDLQYKPKSQEQ